MIIFSAVKKHVATVILLYIPRIHGPNGYFKPYLYVAALCSLTQNEFLIKINFYAIHLGWENFMTMILTWKNKTDTFCQSFFSLSFFPIFLFLVLFYSSNITVSFWIRNPHGGLRFFSLCFFFVSNVVLNVPLLFFYCEFS